MSIRGAPVLKTGGWMCIIGASGYIDARRLDPLVEESLELTRMMSASIRTARSRLQ